MLARGLTSGSAVPRIPHDLAQRRLLKPSQLRYTSPYSQGRAALICRASKVPAIKLNFQTAEGPTTVECESGDILRDVMLDQKVDLYTTWGKVWTCGGNGQCGTCVVKVIDGSNLVSERNSTEEKKLKKKPDSYRLACQLNVGDGTNTGAITLQTKPP